jgi:arylsulfatase A-like enzyme
MVDHQFVICLMDSIMKTELVVLEESRPESEVKASRPSRSARDILQRMRQADIWNRPWLGWAFVYTSVLVFCSSYRGGTLTALITMYGDENDCRFGVEIAVLSLGLLQDFVCASYLAFLLWLVDAVNERYAQTPRDIDAAEPDNWKTLRRAAACGVVLVSSWSLFVCAVGPFAADLLLVRLRGARFTLHLLATKQENSAIDAMTSREMTQVHTTVAVTACAAGCFALVRAWAPWAKLTRWNPTQFVVVLARSRCLRTESNIRTVSARPSYDDDEGNEDFEEVILEFDEASRASMTNTPDNSSFNRLGQEQVSPPHPRIKGQVSKELLRRRITHVAFLLVALVLLPLIVAAISGACPDLVAYSALNATVNDLFGHLLGDTSQPYVAVAVDGASAFVETFIDSSTESYMLFQDDSLYRRTSGFHGDLAFDVDIDDKDPPNVLLVVVESFRFHDSHYLVGDEDPSNLFKGTNITITPNFDKWAARGVALANFWSSWRTSRSVESLQYAQLPYDSVEDSGMTGGKADVALSGLPQLFKAKGYEPFFTTGCQTEYDDWNAFLPAHGFDTVWSRDEMMRLAESDLNISQEQWYGEEQRGLYWGVHDDVSFQLLGDLLLNKTEEQSDRVARGEDKKPLFLTHYTISSHVPFQERPKWFADAEKPDFAALFEGEEYAELIKNYLEMRYFTDVELGKFLDRMADEGILNDTIVIVSGDHGQAPEFGYDTPEARALSATRVAGALIAEGRLGDYVGMKLEDAAEQYDILNTLADIVGVPEVGFLQDGVGRSLKRKVPFGERVVFSNNPSRKMSAIRGNKRLQYDRYSNEVLLHDAQTDHDMQHDLFSDLSSEEKEEWLAWRSNGRWLNSYYTTRWDQKCLLTEC